MTNLDELDRLLREATPGPWSAEEWRDAAEDVQGFSLTASGYLLPLNSCTGAIEEVGANAALIAALRNSAEELIRDARRYRWLRDGNNDLEGLCPFVAGDDLDAALDAAIAHDRATVAPREG